MASLSDSFPPGGSDRPAHRAIAPILTIDVGTSGVRAALVDHNGRLVIQARRPLTIHFEGNDVAEQEPERVWEEVAGAVRELVHGGCGPVSGIGVTAALGFLLAEKDGTALHPAMMWADRRAHREAARIAALSGGQFGLYAQAGRRIDPELGACKFLWLRDNAPELCKRARTAYTLKDWLVQRLCGHRVTDPSSASYSLLFGVVAQSWSGDLCRALGIAEGLMPPVKPASALAGALTPQAAANLHLAQGTPVAVGGPDGSVGVLGAGAGHPGIIVDVMGSTDVIFGLAEQPQIDPKCRVITNAYLSPGLWSIGGPTGLTGGSLAWFARLLLPEASDDTLEARGSSIDRLLEEAASIGPGAGGVRFTPSLAGDRAPRWNPEAKGAFSGLTATHCRAHLVRAILEGCALSAAETIDAIADTQVPVEQVRVAGGGATSHAVLQIRADMLGKEILVPEVTEATSIGAAVVVAVGLGVYDSVDQAAARMIRVVKRVRPQMAAAEIYRSLKRPVVNIAATPVPDA